ncbi:MAG: DUF2087 domain-containing protein [Betaproteobacteria bacterium]|nr:DUF2087 domain-containing protein [Betaproteobacteria bacterium]
MSAFPNAPSSHSAALSERLRRLVVKQGVGLGLLPADDLALALGWVWMGLPADRVMNEAEVNAVLKAQLAGPAACLDADHVELRRWLVDAGWLHRDGYGREYRRVPGGPARHGALAETLGTLLSGTDSSAWAAAQRGAHAAERDARRQRWQRQGQPGGAT